MPFAEYIRQRKSYTEGGQVLREALISLPPDASTVQDVLDHLRRTGAPSLATHTAMDAAERFRDLQRIARQQRQA